MTDHLANKSEAAGAFTTSADDGLASDDSIGPAEVRVDAARRRRRWPLFAALLAILAGPVVVLALIDIGIAASTRDAIHTRIDELEPAPVALILGTARYIPGGRNPFYEARMDAAAELFRSGRVRGILASGDNGSRQYNEPAAMRTDLIARGVPAEYITLDYAGFRTLDSIIRAKEVFGVDRAIIVSQRFHAERALFLARRFGLDAVALAADDPRHLGLLKVRAREVFARAAAVLDVITDRGPRFLGQPETVRLRPLPVGEHGSALTTHRVVTGETGRP